ncbi:His Kinase A (phospho-acceptor) domain-containing protein [Actinoplanes regularis]|uniref:histidine kinase n=2 Tax=Actinoplanes regularis TaxID=52697 RepID=A0A238W951_9ACTN|nr:ATP-binding protein [Actinoplanes regularis]SNR43038.1 His Kinase A (phospho-acceptor) domain-containing protein [Actinoplanes regularis]
MIVNVALIAALVAVALLGYFVSRRQETMAGEAREAQQLTQAAQQVKYRAADFNGWQTAYALDIVRAVPGATDDSSPSRAAFLDAAAKFENELATLDALAAPPEIKRTVDAIEGAFAEFMAVDQEALQLYRAGGAANTRVASDLVVNREVEIYVQIADGCEVASDLSAATADADFARLEAVGVATRRYIVVLCLFAVVLAVVGVTLAEARQRAVAERADHAQRLASLGQLAGGIAHDFNNVLSIILNYTDFVTERVPEDAREDLARIRTAAERAAGLTAQLLIFIRQDAVHPEVLDINAAIAEAHAILARTIGENIDLVMDPSPVPLKICVDAGQVQQILVNLAVNARDAMPGGGTLVIAAAAVDIQGKRKDLRPAIKPGRYVELRVSDTGTGMSPETVSRIFEPFFTTKAKGHGTGLGLATVYGIIAATGGSINVSSKLGSGTTFRIYFPVAEEFFDQGCAVPPGLESPRGRGESILIVEDEPVLAASIARILATGGYQVRSVSCGSEAIDAHARDGCDLLVTDVVMPEMSGPSLAAVLHRADPRLPVLYISGYSVGFERLLEPGAHLLPKPFSADQLLAAVSGTLAEVHAKAGKAPGP